MAWPSDRPAEAAPRDLLPELARLTAALSSDEPDAAQEAAREIALLPVDLPQLIRLLEDPDRAARAAAHEWILFLGSSARAAASLLAEALEDADEEEGRLILRSLRRVGDGSPAVIAALESAAGRQGRLGPGAASALLILPKGEPAVAALLRDGGRGRANALRALRDARPGERALESYFSLTRASLKDPAPDIRQAAAEALAEQFPRDEAVSDLLALLQTHEETDSVAAAAAGALARIGLRRGDCLEALAEAALGRGESARRAIGAAAEALRNPG